MQREGARIGVSLTLEEPSKATVTEAASAGFYPSLGWGQNYPKLQILTLAELLHGAKVKMPLPAMVNTLAKMTAHSSFTNRTSVR